MRGRRLLDAGRCLGLLLALAPAASSGQGTLSPGLEGGFVHQQWTVEDGLPVNNLTDVVQTPDGWLWIASFDGLLPPACCRCPAVSSAAGWRS